MFLGNDTCLNCGSALGYRPSTRSIVVLEDGDQRCSLWSVIGCTWLVEDGLDHRCRSCRRTTVTPPRGDDALVEAWREAEHAKRRLFHQCLGLGLPIEEVAFELRAGRVGPVTTGHKDGVVTIDVDEADDARRVARREQLHEAYRTLLGHFRHEAGHALFPRVVAADPDLLARFRARFGDERADYGAALEQHYGSAPPAGWHETHVSAYATAHPHEDWAETFAHYLHLRAALHTAQQVGVDPALLFASWPVGGAPMDGDDFAALFAAWRPLTLMLNAVNRSMGHEDPYPFSLAPAVADKLRFVHDVVVGT